MHTHYQQAAGLLGPISHRSFVYKADDLSMHFFQSLCKTMLTQLACVSMCPFVRLSFCPCVQIFSIITCAILIDRRS